MGEGPLPSGPSCYGIEGSVGVGRVGSGGSVGMSDVGAGVGVGCADGVAGTVGAAVAAAEAAGIGVGAANDVDAVGADEPCGRCVGATDAVTSRGCCVTRTGVGESAGPAEVRAGGRVAGEPSSIPATPEEMSSGTMTSMPTTTPSVAPMNDQPQLLDCAQVRLEERDISSPRPNPNAPFD
jgi:hypothetical protein